MGSPRTALVDPNKKLAVGDQVTIQIVEDREAPVSKIITATGDLDVDPLERVHVAGKTTKEAVAEIERRGQGKERFTTREVEDFYALFPRWGTPVQLNHWMEKHPERKAQDAKVWARFLHAWGDDMRAWTILQSTFPEPPFPVRLPPTARAQLEIRWNTEPGDFVNARVLAHLLAQSGDLPGSAKIIMTVAQKPSAPVWFVHKAAHLLAKEGRISEAVALVVR